MVEFLNTHVTHRTMFRSRGLVHFAGLTPVLLLKDDFVVVKSLYSRLKVILCNVSGANETSHEVSKIAEDHDERSNVLVVLSDIGVRHVVEAVKNINVKAAKRAGEIN
jgi:hypothetical protein